MKLSTEVDSVVGGASGAGWLDRVCIGAASGRAVQGSATTVGWDDLHADVECIDKGDVIVVKAGKSIDFELKESGCSTSTPSAVQHTSTITTAATSSPTPIELASRPPPHPP